MVKKAFLLLAVLLLSGCLWLSGCGADTEQDISGAAGGGTPERQAQDKSLDELEIVGSMELKYAEQFSVDYLEDGYALVSITESGRFLVVPEGLEAPGNIDEDIAVMYRPAENIYLAATSAMCLFDALDALPHVTMSGVKAEGWYIENARAAMESGAMAYAGKYNAPDYELIMAKDCSLAIESTMIDHTPDVKEKLEDLGIPVLTERSSYETHPLGRTEWIKLYALLVGEEERAAALFDEQTAYLDNIPGGDTGKSVAFFYISSSGNAVVRKSGDYVTEMIELAGGNYVFTDLDTGNATGSVNLEMERFYSEAKDADFIIYNSSIDGEIRAMDELLAKSPLIADFKAVKNGDVWCTGNNLFQETTGFGLLISDMHRIFTEAPEDLPDLNFLYRLQ